MQDLTPGVPVLYDVVDQCVAGVIRRLLLDRGFLDRGKIARRKRTHGIDILIPLRKNMDVCQDAPGLVRHKRFATLTLLEYTELLLTLSDTARQKILEKTRRLRRDLVKELRPARPP